MRLRVGGLAQRRDAVIAVAVALVVVPPIVDLCGSWRRRPFSYIAADTFYYLTVGRNLSRLGRLAYDQEHPSNSFHPLWQAVVALLSWLADQLHRERQLVLLVVLVGLAFVAASVVLWGLTLARGDGSLSPLFCGVPVGAYALIVCPMWIHCMPNLEAQNPAQGAMPLFGTLWSYANGMESGAVLLFVSLAAWLGRGRAVWTSGKRASALGLSLGLVVLSRLDHLLLVAPALAALCWAAVVDRSRLRSLGWLLVAFTLPVGSYLVANRVLFGVFVPISGTLKSSFPAITGANLDAIERLIPGPGKVFLLARAFRQAQLVVPALAAVAFLFLAVRLEVARGRPRFLLRGNAAPEDAVLLALAGGVILLAAYDFLYVRPECQGPWYCPASTMFVSLAAIRLAERARFEWRPSGRAVAAGVLAWVIVAVGMFVTLHRQPGYNERYAWFYWDEAPRVTAHYAGQSVKLTEGDDGIIAYSLDMPVMSSALGLDPEGARAFLDGRLVRLAIDRGFGRFTSLVYGSPLSGASSKEALRAWVGRVYGGDLSGVEFTLDYVSSDGNFAILRGALAAP